MKTPEMKHGTVEMVSVEWIMQNTTDSIDGFGATDEEHRPYVDYGYLVRSKATDHCFGDLVGTIMERGFRVPIVLVQNYYAEGDLMHGNGHHRMAAAILLGIDEIPVYWNDARKSRGYMCSDRTDTEEVLHGTEWSDLAYELEEVLY